MKKAQAKLFLPFIRCGTDRGKSENAKEKILCTIIERNPSKYRFFKNMFMSTFDNIDFCKS